MRDNGPYLGFTADRRPTAVHYFDRANQRDREGHLALFGKSGAGKDVRILAPNMALLRRSVFLLDLKGEQAALTYHHRSRFSKVIVFNPFGVLTDTHPHLKSHGYEPLKHPLFKPSNPNFNSIATGLGDSMNPMESNQPFFPLSARALTAAGCMWERKINPTNPSLANVRAMLSAYHGTRNDEPVGLLKDLFDMSLSGERYISNKINGLLRANNETAGVISTVRANLAFLDDPQIVADMRKAEPFDFADMKRELITVYFIMPADKVDGTFANYIRLVIGSALRDCMQGPPGDGPRPLMIANEAAQLGGLECLSAAHGIARGYGWSIFTTWQSIAQIRNNFGKNADTILGGCGVISSFAPDLVTAEYLSKLAGTRGEFTATYSAVPGQPQMSRQESPGSFPLIRPDDLMRMPRGRLIHFMEPVEFPFFTNAPGYWDTQWASCFESNPYYRASQQTQRRPVDGGRKALEELKRRRQKD